jgi:hypothetical protein
MAELLLGRLFERIRLLVQKILKLEGVRFEE